MKKKEEGKWEIINLTNLSEDYSKDIVEIIKKVMDERVIESRKKAVEFIIRDYKRKTDNFQAERQELNDEIEQLKKEKFEQYDLLKKHVAVSTSVKELLHHVSLV